MSDLTSHRQQVAELGKQAVEAEKVSNWEMAYDCYMQALKVFIHMIKCKFSNPLIICLDEKNDSLKSMYKDKFNSYENRAKQIKKSILDAQGAAQT